MLAESHSLLFQCLDLVTQDSIILPEDDSDTGSSSVGSRDSGELIPFSFIKGAKEADNSLHLKRFQILLFGVDEAGQSVCLQVEDFRPYFFVRLPEGCSASAQAALEEWVRAQVPPACEDLVSMRRESHKTLLDYTGGVAAAFLRIEVPSQSLWRRLKDAFLTKGATGRIYATKDLFGTSESKQIAKTLKDPAAADSVGFVSGAGDRIALKVYEANIDPVLRFFHERDLSPAGWMFVGAGHWEPTEGSAGKAKICATCSWTHVEPKNDKNALAPLTVASWDIECTSSHGDFPIAAKTWRKPVRELAEARDACPSTVEGLCAALAAAIRADSNGLLSPVYLKKPTVAFGPNTLPETVANCFAAAKKTGALGQALGAVRAAATGAERDAAIQVLDELLTGVLPPLEGDAVIQIGTVLYRRGEPLSKHIWVLGDVAADQVRPPGVEVPVSVYSYRSELDMLRSWIRWMGTTDPDVVIGYNIFGFDERYVWDRIQELAPGQGGPKGVKETVKPWSRLKTRPVKLEEKFLSSSAMGDNTMWILTSVGRLHIDLLPHIRRSYNLDSYTLDNVSATFVSGAVTGPLVLAAEQKGARDGCGLFRFPTKSTKGTVVGRYITLLDAENDRVIDRCRVVTVEPKALIVEIDGGQEALDDHGLAPERWAQVKDDVSPKDIFRLHRGSAADRAVIAKYCLQDCDLVMELFNKLDILNNSVAMANVCSVPVSYIFLRGQGIKIESLIFKECRRFDQLIEVMPSPSREELEVEKMRHGEFALEDVGGYEAGEGDEEGEDTYEGAIVLEPHTGIYIDDPVTADDFASLYPSSIISENISHDTLIWVKDYDNDGKFVCCREGSDRFDNLVGAKYVNVEFDILRPDPAEAHKKHPAKIRDGRRVARYIQEPQGTIPRILEMLLGSRKRCRKLAETEPDEFTRNLLDAQQLAYKLTANSLYGQLGSATFKVRRQVLAASTTAYGRKQLMFAKAVIEEVYGGGRDSRCDVECVYGDTDSIFLRFRPRDPVTGAKLTGKQALQVAKDLTVESGKLVSSCLKAPHDFEFDKIFRSFILLSKKRYVGDMSEDGVEDEDFHRKSMGIVMKRRDNAPIVKYVYGHAIDAILDPTRLDVAAGVQEAAAFVKKATRDLLAGKFALSKLTITKSLRAGYADPTRIAHKVLADRIAERDPGNKPSTSDRIPFVFFENPKGKLSGDKIELPSYIKEHGLRPDFKHYITNQIANPVSQVFALGLEYLSGIRAADIRAAEKAKKPVEAREKLAQRYLFEEELQKAAQDPTAMEARGQRSIATMFKGTYGSPLTPPFKMGTLASQGFSS
jgi:DNA polymerase elongation subunit (family B)